MDGGRANLIGSLAVLPGKSFPTIYVILSKVSTSSNAPRRPASIAACSDQSLPGGDGKRFQPYDSATHTNATNLCAPVPPRAAETNRPVCPLPVYFGLSACRTMVTLGASHRSLLQSATNHRTSSVFNVRQIYAF